MSDGAPQFDCVTLWFKFSGANAGSILMPSSEVNVPPPGSTDRTQWLLSNLWTDGLGEHVLSTDETFYTDLSTAGAFASRNILAVTGKAEKKWNVAPFPVFSGTLLWCTTSVLPSLLVVQFTRV